MRRLGAVRREQGFVGAGDVLRALVGVEPLWRRSGPSRRVLERLDDERGRVVIGYMPADDLAGEDVDDGREVPEPVGEPEVGEVSGPDDVRAERAQSLEDVLDARFGPAEVAGLRETGAAADPRFQAEDAHDPPSRFPVHAER